jgi:hypothetical protein
MLNPMEKHSAYTDIEFTTLFKNCELPPSEFTHEAHLRLAWIYITWKGLEEAEEIIIQQLRSFVNHVGAAGKFNKTLTIASVRMVNHYISKSTSANFSEFITQFPELKLNFKGLIQRHYGFDIFSNEKAKSDFLEPDLLPFGK